MMRTEGADPPRPTAPAPDAPVTEDERIDEIVDDSFPASDPPPTSGSRAGTPKRKPDGGGTKNEALPPPRLFAGQATDPRQQA